MTEFVLDTSIVVSIALRETGWEALQICLATAQRVHMCAGTALECELVLLKKAPFSVEPGRFWSYFQNADTLDIVAFDKYRLNIAKQALHDYGSGKHRLNYGDCYAYSLARTLGLPLLFKGTDFAATNVKIHSASVITP